jgi:hypothetical protein
MFSTEASAIFMAARDLLFVLAQGKLREGSAFPPRPLAPGKRRNGRSAARLKDLVSGFILEPLAGGARLSDGLRRQCCESGRLVLSLRQGLP